MIREGLTFDDVLLVPQHSKVISRSKVDLSVDIGIGLFSFSHPIIPANMKTVTGFEMMCANYHSGGLSILHRFMQENELLDIANKSPSHKRIGFSVGVKENDKELAHKLYKLGVRIFCVDIAHGDSSYCESMTTWLKQTFRDSFIISGNVATGQAAMRLWKAGADAVKVGVGPGSLCTTRIETGNGVPQLTALMDVADKRRELKLAPIRHANMLLSGIKNLAINPPVETINSQMYIIADGGIKNSGDCVKALCFADMLMAGNLFAGCKEAPGKTHTINGICYKEYVGSSTHKASHIEGVEAMVPCKGTYNELLTKLLEGIRSGCSYQGVQNLKDLKDNPEFVRITNSGLKESHPHDVVLK